MQHIHEKINSETKLSFLKDCKSSNQISTYLINLTGRKKRSLFGKLRLGTLDLELEKGRRYNIPRPERHCKICHSQVVENEQHFLIFCPSLTHCREPFIRDITALNPHFSSFTPDQKITYLYFNECLPQNILEIAANLLVALEETRKSLLNLI